MNSINTGLVGFPPLATLVTADRWRRDLDKIAMAHYDGLQLTCTPCSALQWLANYIKIALHILFVVVDIVPPLFTISKACIVHNHKLPG